MLELVPCVAQKYDAHMRSRVKTMKILTFLSDFGAGSPYPAAMKAVACGIVPPEVRLIDITHEIQPHGVREGAFVLWSAARDFPEGTVHCAVVDPGVGTERRGIILHTGGQLFVGPDNGLLDPAARALGEPQAFAIANKRYLRGKISHTFHGRDVFAPVAAHLAAGVPAEEIGGPLDDWVRLDIDFRGGRWDEAAKAFLGQIVYIDRFGNAITNIPSEALLERVAFDQTVTLVAKGRERVVKLRRSYGYAERGELCLVPGSHDLIEISVREGSAYKKLSPIPGDPVLLRP
jgi:S-adenosylmethionine hydrolase